MRAFSLIGVTGFAVVLATVGCASSPEVTNRYQVAEVRIDSILAEAAATPGLGAPERCLSEMQFRNFRALDDRYILFEGTRDRHWINKLHSRCFDLEHATVLRVRSFSSMRVCELDTFMPADWFDWPWYRRWPWYWGRWPSGGSCMLGKFQPVSAEQASAIEVAIRAR